MVDLSSKVTSHDMTLSSRTLTSILFEGVGVGYQKFHQAHNFQKVLGRL